MCRPAASGSIALGAVSNTTDTAAPLKKLLHLPARSLLILTGEARYEWQHGIAPRRSDKIDGRMVPRGRRVSLTFRQVGDVVALLCRLPRWFVREIVRSRPVLCYVCV
jgi:hypothetical protein